MLYGTTTLTDKGMLVGDVVTNEGNLYFLNNSAATFTGSLTGNVAGDSTGAGDMAVKGASVWYLDGDSTVGALTLDNGTVDFRPPTTTRLTPVFRAVSLALDTLSGNRTFRMNTDIASHTGDMLKVTGNASGNFVLDIKNTGLEPVSAGAPLQVVQTGGGDAAFPLNA